MLRMRLIETAPPRAKVLPAATAPATVMLLMVPAYTEPTSRLPARIVPVTSSIDACTLLCVEVFGSFGSPPR